VALSVFYWNKSEEEDVGSTFKTSYLLSVEWLISWYPSSSFSSLNQVKMRGGTIVHRNTEDVFISGNREVHELGHDLALVSFAARVGAVVDVGVVADNDLTFQVKIEGFNGSFRRRKRFTLPESLTTPFMLNVQFQGKDEITGDTTLTFQGVFVTSDSFTGETPPPEFGG
jgi:hypothetical protein